MKYETPPQRIVANKDYPYSSLLSKAKQWLASRGITEPKSVYRHA